MTGAEGFVGGHLIEFLAARGDEVHGTTLSLGLLGDHIPRGVDIQECDVLNEQRLDQLLQESTPEVVIHLAAVSSVSMARTQPALTARVNIQGTLSLLESASKLNPKPSVLFVSTCEVYGSVAEKDCPIAEELPIKPQSIYAASKASAEVLAGFYARARGLPVVIVRSFNHTGPRQAPVFVCSAFAKQIAEIERGKSSPIVRVGNLAARRDFLDVRDVVRAYALALEKGSSGVAYNVCSGRAVSVLEILNTLLSLSDAAIEVEVSEELMRPLDIPLLVGSHDRFSEATDWLPDIPLERTLRDLLNYWRNVLK
ncbi:MAG: GDP-mannose 4,6-dehydratase [Candidatus Coatesbacteria bacterium]|nr:GDP-mannose 4,6-dehydratase [Candidatus Coatesbacteria bacterium]